MARRRGGIVRRGDTFAIRYYGADGRRHLETIGVGKEGERAAERALTARLRELDTGQWREPSDQTVAEYAERWLERRSGRVASSTLAEYRRSLRLYVLPHIGGRTLADLRPVHVDGLVAELERDGRAAGTIRNAITPLRKMLADAVRLGVVATNAAARADLPPAREFVGQELAVEDTTAIRDALAALAPVDPLREGERDLFYVCLFDVALGSALRLGELRALRWQDVDRERRLIRVERAYSRGEVKRPKTEAGVRAVPLFPSVEVAVQALAARALERGRYAPGELVFSNERGGALWPSNLTRRVWTEALKQAGLGEWVRDERDRRVWRNRYRFHDLRHTAISRLVAAGADVKLVQALAGHANPLITLKRYSHLLDDRVTEAATRFDPATVKTAETDGNGNA